MGVVTGAVRSKQQIGSARQTFSRVAGRWLRWQCQLLNDVRFAAVVDAADLSTGAGFPSSRVLASIGSNDVPLIAAGDPSEHQKFVVKGMDCWQVPVAFPGKSLCVIIHMDALNSQAQTAADRLLRWGVLNLTDWLADAQMGSSQSMPPLRLMLSQKTLDQAAARWVDDVQIRTQAARVSVGWFDSGRSRLLAVSGVTALDARRALPRAMVSAMGECVKAAKTVQYPVDTTAKLGPNIDLVNHQTLHERYGEKHIVSIPLVQENETIAVLLLEYPPNQKHTVSINDLVDEVSMATPVLFTLSERKPGLGLFVKRCVQRTRQVLFNPTTKLQKLGVYTALVMTLMVLFFPFPHNATIRGEIQGADRQVLAATHQGFLKSASARAGDQVNEGQVLAQFDHTQMRLQRDTWVSELTRIDSAIVQAMTSRDKAALGRLRAEQSSANAELDLIDHQITQSDVVAPFSGILVSGDLDDRLGASVEAGESLFQIASLDDYTLQLEVPERHAVDISLGSVGNMRFAAFPSQPFSFSVESTIPVAIPEEGANIFRMQANLDGDTDAIRPGMTGVAKVSLGNQSLVSRVLDFISHRMRYWWWSFGA